MWGLSRNPHHVVPNCLPLSLTSPFPTLARASLFDLACLPPLFGWMGSAHALKKSVESYWGCDLSVAC